MVCLAIFYLEQLRIQEKDMNVMEIWLDIPRSWETNLSYLRTEVNAEHAVW